jgi:hypothetical protein
MLQTIDTMSEQYRGQVDIREVTTTEVTESTFGETFYPFSAGTVVQQRVWRSRCA